MYHLASVPIISFVPSVNQYLPFTFLGQYIPFKLGTRTHTPQGNLFELGFHFPIQDSYQALFG